MKSFYVICSMGGCRCSYRECLNTTKSSENLHFYHFPVKNRERCVQWIENSCKPSFYQLEEDQLRNKVVCELHFEKKWFVNSHKKRLLQGAIPTLDTQTIIGPNGKPLIKSEVPLYEPSDQYQDVKVIPANEDNTVFILDTDNMFTVSPKIQSYIIKNGSVVAASPYTLDKTINSKHNKSKLFGSYGDLKTDMSALHTYPAFSGPSKLIKGSTSRRPNILKKNTERAVTLLNQMKIPEHITESNTIKAVHEIPPAVVDTNIQENSKPTKPDAIQNNSQNQQNYQKSLVTKNCLRKLRQHSRDIATIKRMLRKKKVSQQKPDLKTILSTLEDYLPPTLFTLISLVLGEKSDLTTEEIEFFTTLHQLSPEAYKLLSEKYKWSIPDIDMTA